MESTLFPISMEKHIIFCVIAALFFLLQFIRTKQWYQLVMAIAVPLSLLIYIDEENTALFYAVGILEAVLLCGALVLYIVQSRRLNREDAAKADSDKQEETAAAPSSEAPSEAAPSAASPADTPAAEETAPAADPAPAEEPAASEE